MPPRDINTVDQIEKLKQHWTEIPCHGCEYVYQYHGLTKNVRINEHEAAMRLNHPEHAIECNHSIDYCNHSIDYNGTKQIKTVKKAQHLDLAEYIVIKKEIPAMNRKQPEVNPVYQALCPLIDTNRRIPAEIQIKQKGKRKRKAYTRTPRYHEGADVS